MERTLNRQELEEQLSGKAQSIGRRLDALQEEVGGLSVRNFIQSRPLAGAAIVLAAGFLAAMLGGRKRKSKRKAPGSVLHKELVERYVETIADEADRLVARGKDVSDAVAKALRGRVPVLVYTPDNGREGSGVVRDIADMALKAATGFAIKSAIDFATSHIDAQSITGGAVIKSARKPPGGEEHEPESPIPS